MHHLFTYARLVLVFTLFHWSGAYAFIPPDEVTVVWFEERVSTLLGFHDGIEQVACWGRSNKDQDIKLLGRAYPTESEQGLLAMQRSEAVRHRLIRLGISPARILIAAEDSTIAQFNYFQQSGTVVIGAKGYKGGASASECLQSWKLYFSSFSEDDALIESERLVSEGLMDPFTPLQAAIAAKRFELVDRLLERVRGSLLETKVREALLKAAVVSGDVAIIGRVIEFGITPSKLPEPGLPMSWLLCESSLAHEPPASDLLSTVEFLVKSGVPLNVSIRDRGERTALNCAARSGRQRLVAQLLRLGADPNFPAGDGPLQHGAFYPDIARMLIAAGANPKEEFSSGGTLFNRFQFVDADDVKWVLSLGLNINEKAFGEETPLESALRYASKKVLDAFIRNGAAFDRKDPRLTRFASGNMDALVWLIDKGAFLDDPSQLLADAAHAGDKAVPVAKALQRRGVDLSKIKVSRPEYTPLNRAIEAFSPGLLQVVAQMRGVTNRATVNAAVLKATKLKTFMGSDLMEADPEAHRARERELNTAELMADRQRRKEKIIAQLKTF